MTARIFWHRWGSLSAPGISPGTLASSTSASMVGSPGLNWSHVWLDGMDGTVLGLDAGPAGDLDALAVVEADLRRAGGAPRATARAAVVAAALASLEASLRAVGRELHRITISSARAPLPAIHEALLSFALERGAACGGAAELHTVVSRDPFVAEGDSLLRGVATTRGVAVVLHDACYLVHPHRLTLASAASEPRSGAVQSTVGLSDDEGGGGGSSAGGGGVSSGGRGATPAPSAVLADCRSSTFLPAHLLSFEVFGRGLHVNATPATRGGSRKSAADSSPPRAVNAEKATSADADAPATERAHASVPTIEDALADFPSAAVLLSNAVEMACGRAPVSSVDPVAAPVRAAVNSVLTALPDTAAVTTLHVLILIAALHVRAHCFDKATVPWASSHSFYIRLCAAAPVLQSLLAAGVVTPGALWAQASSLIVLLSSIRDLSPTLVDESKQRASAPPVTFVTAYAKGILRFLTKREHASHIVYYRPTLAYAPARPELVTLPWATLPTARPKIRSRSPGRMPAERRASAGGGGGGSNSGGMTPSATTWWTPTGMVTSVIDAFPALPSVVLPGGLSSSLGGGVASAQAETAETGLANALRALYPEASESECVEAFAAGLTGWPLLDAALACANTAGILPAPLLPVLAAVWCKHYGRPWHEAARWLAAQTVDADPALTALRWQWTAGFAAGPQASPSGWLQPVDAPDILTGFAADSWLPLAREAADGPLGADEVAVLLRFHPCLVPHPHAMGHPAGVELAAEPDPTAVFVRTFLAPHTLAPGLPDAFIYEPSNAPPWVLAAAGQTLVKGGGGARAVRARAGAATSAAVYPTPLVALSHARERTLDAVLAARRLAKTRPLLADLSGWAGAQAAQAAAYAASMHALVSQTVSFAANSALRAADDARRTLGLDSTAAAAASAAAPPSLRALTAAATAAAPVAPLAAGGARVRGRSSVVSTLGAMELASSSRATGAWTAIDVAAEAFVSAQVTSGYDREWGMTTQGVAVDGEAAAVTAAPSTTAASGSSWFGWGSAEAAPASAPAIPVSSTGAPSIFAPAGPNFPVIVEEDTAILIAAVRGVKADGWTEVLDDVPRRLRVSMGGKQYAGALSAAFSGMGGGTGVASSGNVQSVLTNGCLPSPTAQVDRPATVLNDERVYEATSQLRFYRQWDLSWQRVDDVCRLDTFNQVSYLIADAPPPPYSFVITPRDFVTVRMSLRLPGCRTSATLFRHGLHARAPPSSAFIRGETLGITGFVTRPMETALFADSHPATAAAARTAGVPSALFTATQPSGEEILLNFSRARDAITPTAAAAAAATRGPLLSLIAPPSNEGRVHLIMTARGDPKGTIPAYLINFVAKRTPGKWVDRLTQFIEAGMRR